MENKKVKIFKLAIFITFILIVIFLTIKILPVFQNIATEEGKIELKNKIQNLGSQGVFIIMGLMFAQIFLPILPGEPVEVLAGMCYGAIGGLIVIYLGSFLSSLVIFFAVRKFGKNFIYSFVSKEKIEKIENSKIFSDSKKIDSILVALYMIPGTPKDLITYLGGLLPIKPIKFLAISTICRFPSVISSTIAGAKLVAGDWKISILVYVITIILTGIVVFVMNKSSKNGLVVTGSLEKN